MKGNWWNIFWSVTEVYIISRSLKNATIPFSILISFHNAGGDKTNIKVLKILDTQKTSNSSDLTHFRPKVLK